jgi:hypothetical protein
MPENAPFARFECLGKGQEQTPRPDTIDACLYQGEFIVFTGDGEIHAHRYQLESEAWLEANRDMYAGHSPDPDSDRRDIGTISGHCVVSSNGTLFHIENKEQESALRYTANAGLPFGSVDAPVQGGDTLQCLLSVDTWLFALTAGKDRQQTLFVSNKLPRPIWQAIDLPQGITDDSNHISHLVYFQDRLYLCIDNPVTGFQLWCATLEDPSTMQWQQVLGEGAYQYSANAHVSALLVAGDRLLIATTAEHVLLEPEARSVAPELLAVDGDNNWMLLVGTTRATDDGLAVPASCMGRGFDDHRVRQVTNMACADEGYLAAVVVAEEDGQTTPQLWHSGDLETWAPFPHALPFGANTAIISMTNTANGLLLLIERIAESDEEKDDSQGPGIEPPLVEGMPASIELWLLRG